MIYVCYMGVMYDHISNAGRYINLDIEDFEDSSLDWVERYVEVARKLDLQDYEVFISWTQEICDYLREQNYAYVCIYPNIGLYREWYNYMCFKFLNSDSERNIKNIYRCRKSFKDDIDAITNEPQHRRWPIWEKDITIDPFNRINLNLPKFILNYIINNADRHLEDAHLEMSARERDKWVRQLRDWDNRVNNGGIYIDDAYDNCEKQEDLLEDVSKKEINTEEE